jgi:hypothetical protein
MLIDTQNMFSDDQAITADAISSRVIDLLPQTIKGSTANVIRDIGAGTPLYLYVLVTTAFDGAADTSSLIVSLESDSTADLATSATVHLTLPEFEEAALVAGAFIAKGVPIPPGNYERYLGLRYNVGAEENFIAGKVQAWLSNARHDTRTYETGARTGVN